MYIAQGAPFSLAMPTSNGAWLFLSTPTSTWSSQDSVGLVCAMKLIDGT